MPKQTFFNLSEQKRKNLLESAEMEFTRAPLFEASIANIIKTAGISRGSFYQYFEDKDDLYFYLLEDKLKKGKIYFSGLLAKHQGDLIEAVIELQNYFLLALSDEEEKQFLKNALLYTTHRVESSFTSIWDTYLDNQEFKKVGKLINRDYLNSTAEKELLHIFKMVSALAFNNLIEKTVKGLSDDEAMESFKLSMSLLKQGIYKQNN
ncbi:TetR/AcrR family transcriptional regulator [Mesobacillus selenatarsenatis]|uniref:Transcriptional regulator, tetr family n=1 Tax=Mesobacillus selenatarsenatis (strain DSM 18680 / JCM 14380 / FERM P-15431 / SF-1) TaxID=1321606 RepID=A0A0A8XBQ0_MESS1|nr:TetR/AcrR family transcriptional regulator [Mesobacillus selenatarsenatis]GAM16709.1 transcriptional regulator, tetr family [Mesobacillus selenatarsenatis SF-1]